MSVARMVVIRCLGRLPCFYGGLNPLRPGTREEFETL
jgi:hypothetical protein